MIRTLLARQARRHAAVLACVATAFMLLGAPGAEAVETQGDTKPAVKPSAAEPIPEPRTSVLVALGLAATAFMARRRN